MPISDCKIIDLPNNVDVRGELVSIEMDFLPFRFHRVFYMYNIKEIRGQHAHKKDQQFVIAISGEFGIKLEDGFSSQIFILNRPNCGLYITNMIWSQLFNFSDNAVCMVLASDAYNESDYFRNYEDFAKCVMHE